MLQEKLSLQIVCALGCLIFACKGQTLERDFFNKPLGNRLERLRQFPLEDQYRIFRYGNDMIEPPLIDLADPIAEKGAAAVPFLERQLRSSYDDITVRDVLLVFQTMATSKSYAVQNDPSLMDLLNSKVAAMKSDEWKSVCLKMLKRIEDSRSL